MGTALKNFTIVSRDTLTLLEATNLRFDLLYVRLGLYVLWWKSYLADSGVHSVNLGSGKKGTYMYQLSGSGTYG